jgi:hypothetical protein
MNGLLNKNQLPTKESFFGKEKLFWARRAEQAKQMQRQETYLVNT